MGFNSAFKGLMHSGDGVSDSAFSGLSFQVFIVYSFHKPKEMRMNSRVTKKLNVIDVVIKIRTV
jgi:hypothetical protein